MSNFVFLTAFIAFFAVGIFAQNADSPMLIGRVTHNQTNIAFTFAGKIWLVPKN
jgi:hypothetical protein